MIGLLAVPAIAAASTLTWDFSTGTVGPTLGQASETFTSTGGATNKSIVTSPFVQNSFCVNLGWIDFGCNDLYGKADGTDENGLGLIGDPSGQHEITTGNFIQLDLVNLLSGYQNFAFSMNSTTDGEEWQACYSATAGTFGSLGCTTGSNEGWNPSILSLPATARYLDFTAIGTGDTGDSRDNILLYKFSADTVLTTTAVPEPASLLLLGTGLVGISRQWRKRTN
jgi:hypothetical protein